jgi:hypothetical protein
MAASKIEIGADVLVVSAKGEHIAAEVIKSNDDGTIDVKFVYRDEEQIITRSPHDETGKRHDSWHFPPAPSAKPAGKPVPAK